MNVHSYTPGGYEPFLPILNQNEIQDEKKKAIIQAMGMAACQAKCLRCQHCSNNKCGNRNSHAD